MYIQTIEINLSGRERSVVRIRNFEEVPRTCYCRTDASGNTNLIIYTVSENGKYMIAEANSDHTVFMLLEIVGKDGDVYITEYINNTYNPMDEMYSHLCRVHWYEEAGFCKLEFFNMDIIPSAHDTIKRIYFRKNK